MKCCNQNDILFTPLYDESFVRKFIGMEGYFANSDKELMRKIQDDSFISKVKNTVIDDKDRNFGYGKKIVKIISDSEDNRQYTNFLPKNKVFECNQYTFCTSIQALYCLIVFFHTDSNSLDLNFGTLDLFDYLKGAILHLRDKYTKKEYAVKIRNLNERKIDKSYSEIFINGKSLIWWFNNYEIFTDKWQPFGVIIDDPKDLYPLDPIDER